MKADLAANCPIARSLRCCGDSWSILILRDAFRGQNGQTLSSIPAAMGSWGNWGGSWGFLQPQSATVFVNNWDTERDGSSMTAANFSAGAVNDTVGTKRYTLANLFMLAQGYGEAQLHSGFRFTSTDFNSYVIRSVAPDAPRRAGGRLAAGTAAGLGVSPIAAELGAPALSVAHSQHDHQTSR